MIINVLNKELSPLEKQYFDKLSTYDSVVNIQTQEFENKVKLHHRDIINDEREILINANNCNAVVFWGFPNEEYTSKVMHSLLERENVYFVAIEEDELLEYNKLKKNIPTLYSKLIAKFIVGDNSLDNTFEGDFYDFKDIVKPEKVRRNSFIEGVSEILGNKHMIWKMAHSLFKQETLSTTLGSYWHIVRDIIFFITYILFMLFIRGTGNIDQIPVVLYLITGLVAWYFISDVYSGGATCIKNSRGIISKVKFPLNIIPVYSVLAIFYRRGMTYIILFLIVTYYLLSGTANVEVHIFKLLYYTIAMLIFTVGFSLLISSFIGISRDFHELYKSIIRIQMYFNPIFWDITSIERKLANSTSTLGIVSNWIFDVLMLNPSVYILTGYRESFGASRSNDLVGTAVFWGIVLFLYVFGFKMQSRLRSLYADVI